MPMSFGCSVHRLREWSAEPAHPHPNEESTDDYHPTTNNHPHRSGGVEVHGSTATTSNQCGSDCPLRMLSRPSAANRHELFVLRRASRALKLPRTSAVCCAAASDHPVVRACSPRVTLTSGTSGVPGKVSLPENPDLPGFSWARQDSNLRPHPCHGCALTN